MKKTLTFLILLLFSACTVTQEFHFNNDFSGIYSLTIDQKDIKEPIPGFKDNGKRFNKQTDSLIQKVKEIDSLGISNIQISWIDSLETFFFAFHFDKIETLNKFLDNNMLSKKEKKDNSEKGQQFKVKNMNTLVFHYPKKDESKTNADISQREHYKYNYIFSFDRNIKKTNNPNVILLKGGKKAILRTNIYDMGQPNFKMDIKFKLE